MPYIDQDLRRLLEHGLVPSSAGELNYELTRACLSYADQHGHSYKTYNDIIGALEAAKMEFYRRAVAPYEDRKIKQNGDVYPTEEKDNDTGS